VKVTSEFAHLAAPGRFCQALSVARKRIHASARGTLVRFGEHSSPFSSGGSETLSLDERPSGSHAHSQCANSPDAF
jgi:hypothetical protein